MPVCKSRGFDIYYETHGGGEGLPLLMLSGGPGSCQGWNVLHTPELSQDRVNVIFDNRGTGQSGDPGGDFTTRDMALDTLAVLDEIGIERAHVLGPFIGGLAAQELALSYPERVQSLILMGTFARADAR